MYRPPYRGGFRYRLACFFAGRNGVDTLYFFLFALSLVFTLLAGIFNHKAWLSLLFSVLELLTFGYAIFRAMSRNIPKRRRENAAFRAFFGKLTLPVRRLSCRFRDRKTHIYRRCPHCKSTLRLARIPGDHVARCPHCTERFAVKVKK